MQVIKSMKIYATENTNLNQFWISMALKIPCLIRIATVQHSYINAYNITICIIPIATIQHKTYKAILL